jgi:hypothetical protein
MKVAERWGNARTKEAKEALMRTKIVALSLGALLVGSLAYPATADKTKMGCEKGKEVWNAQAGKCEPGEYTKKAAKKPAKKAAKKASEK